MMYKERERKDRFGNPINEDDILEFIKGIESNDLESLLEFLPSTEESEEEREKDD